MGIKSEIRVHELLHGEFKSRSFLEHRSNASSQNLDRLHEGSSKIQYDPEWSASRRRLAELVDSSACDIVMTAILLLNLILAILIVDAEASGQDVPMWVNLAVNSLVLVYCIEVSARVFVFRWQFFCSTVNQFDLLIVIADLVTSVFEVVSADVVSVDVAPFRIIRMVRLLRSARIMIMFRSLYLLVHGMAGATKAVAWALAMISLALILCSVFAVAVIQPYVDELARESDVFDGCERCAIAYSSVWRAYVTFFQQIVIGDEWGAVTIPVMDAHPWTGAFFIPAVLIIQLGLINMILAVIVDRAEDAREKNHALKLELKDQEIQQAQQVMRTVCREMDTDGSGELSLDEILDGYDSNRQFHEILQLMDVGKEDMRCVFNILDADKSGTCSYEEFVSSLWKMKAQDSHTLLVFIKSYVTDVKRSLEESMRMLENDIGIKLKELHEHHVPEDDESVRSPSKSSMRGSLFRRLSQADRAKEPKIRTESKRTSAQTDALSEQDPIRGDTKADDGARQDAPMDSEVATLLRQLSNNIEDKLEKLSQHVGGLPLTVTDRQVARSGSPVQSPPQSHWPAALCFAAESVSLTRAPIRTPAVDPSGTDLASGLRE